MTKQVIAVVGCPGAGKTWVCNQLKDKFSYLAHDDYIKYKFQTGPSYLKAIFDKLKDSKEPVLIEIPFSISELKEPLHRNGVKVTTVFIIEDLKTIKERYENRDKKPIPKGHLTRQETYRQKAKQSKSFMGTSEEVLKYLKELDV